MPRAKVESCKKTPRKTKKPINNQNGTNSDSIVSEDETDEIPKSPVDSDSDSKKSLGDVETDSVYPQDFSGGMSKLLERFSSDLNKTMLAKRRKLEQFTQESTRSTTRKVLETNKTQSAERRKLIEQYQAQLFSVLQQGETEVEKMKEAEDKLQKVLVQQQKQQQQIRIAHSQRMKVLKNLSEEFCKIIKGAIDKKKNVVTKSSNVDLVTETDKQVEEFLIQGFKKKFPDHCFIGEETTLCELTDSPTWIIDPVDGTMNFVHSFPYTAVSIGLSFKKNIVLGIVYNPMSGDMFAAVKGKGANCCGKKLQVSNTTELSQALILTEFGSDRSAENMEQLFTNIKMLTEKAHGLRMMGSAALNMCAVAAGHADAYVEYSIHCWDMAAAKIIVEEAGGVVIDPTGEPLDLMSRRVLCTSSQSLADTLSKELKHIQFPRDQ